jgi:hypothetical protein
MSYIPRSEIRTAIQESIPDGYLEATFHGLLASYEWAEVLTRRYRRPERKSVFGHIRRAEFETAWQDISRVFGVDVSIGSNSHGGSEHAIVRMGRIVLTESAIDDIGEFPPDAKFRENLALQARQVDWMRPSQPLRDPDSSIYVIFTYGLRGAPQPYFAQLIVPDETGTYTYDRISLTQKLIEARATYQPIGRDGKQIPEERIADHLPIVARAAEEHIPDDLPIGLSAEAVEKQRKQREKEERERAERLKTSGQDGDGE